MPSEKYLEARAKIAAAKKEAQELAKSTFEEEASALLKDLDITSFSWTQYTPYFNDGDECVFSVYSDYPKVNGKEDMDMDGAPESKDFGGYNQEWNKAYRAWRETLPQTKVANFLIQWEEEDMLFMFGDHAQVEVSDKGIVVEDYNHD